MRSRLCVSVMLVLVAIMGREGSAYANGRSPGVHIGDVPVRAICEDRTGAEHDLQAVDGSVWERIHSIERGFRTGLENRDPRETTNALLELDRVVWKAQQDLESSEFISQAREIFRDMIVQFGMTLETSPIDRSKSLAPLVGELLALRDMMRDQKKWQEADAIRQILNKTDIVHGLNSECQTKFINSLLCTRMDRKNNRQMGLDLF